MLEVVQVPPIHYKLVSKTARKLLDIRGVLLFAVDDVRISKRVEALAEMDSEVIK